MFAKNVKPKLPKHGYSIEKPTPNWLPGYTSNGARRMFANLLRGCKSHARFAPGCRTAVQDHLSSHTPHPELRVYTLPPRWAGLPNFPKAARSIEIFETAPALAPLPGRYKGSQCLLNVRFTPRPLPGPADSFPASWILLFLSLTQNRPLRLNPYLPTSGG